MTAAIRASIANDLRALLPTWVASIGALIMFAVIGDRWFMNRDLAFLAYVLGALTLGAQAIGHEYTHRTLPLLLSQPLDRRLVLAVKLGVAALFVSSLTAAAYVLLDFGGAIAREPMIGWVVHTVWLTALLLAPALTIACRSTMAGALFSGSIPAIVGLSGGIVGWLTFGSANDRAVDSFQASFFWRVMPVVWAVSALATWRLMATAPAIDGRGRDIHVRWPGRVTSTRSRVRHPFWRLVSKELHLQQMTLAGVAIYLLVVAVLLLRRALEPDLSLTMLVPITSLYVLLFALVAGALASAEERHLGTRDAQVLLPMAGWQQWAVKTGVVLGLVLALSIVLPAAVVVVIDDPSLPLAANDLWARIAIVILVASGSLYVSSLSSSAVNALVWSVPFAAGGIWLAIQVDRFVTVWASQRQSFESPDLTILLAAAVLAHAIFVSMLLGYGHVNHRSAESGVGRALRQVPVLAITLVALVAALNVVTVTLQ